MQKFDRHYSAITDLVGNTPLIELRNFDVPNNNKILVKCEFYNPAGGVKDRIAMYILDMLAKQNKLNVDSTVIEATAGNTGLAIALAAIKYNIKAILVVPSKFSQEKQILMRALGAEVVNTNKEDGMSGAIKMAYELLDSIPNSFSINQFENENNPQAHYNTTAREIYDATCGKLDYFVCGAGSGGTISGVMQYLKEQNKNIKGVLCDPISSVIGNVGSIDNCGMEESIIEGIGNNFIPKTMDISLIDEVIKISNDDALNCMRELARTEGLLVGISSGANVYGALKLSHSVHSSIIVTIAPDSIDKYFSKGFIS